MRLLSNLSFYKNLSAGLSLSFIGAIIALIYNIKFGSIIVKPQLFPVKLETSTSFFQRFRAPTQTLDKLNDINPYVIESLKIDKDSLAKIIDNYPSADSQFLKISLVQIPDINITDPSLNNLNAYKQNLYFLFGLANSGKYPPSKYFDLHFQNRYATKPIDNNFVKTCIDSFLLLQTNGIDRTNSLRSALLKIVKYNTEEIHVNIIELKAYLYEMQRRNQNFKYINLEFCQIDMSVQEMKEPKNKKRMKGNDKHFGCLWRALDTAGNPIDAPLYDLNSLCPNVCYFK